MSLEQFVTNRRETLQKELAEAELELVRLEHRQTYLTQAVSQLRVALNMLDECQAYQEGKHPSYPQAAQEPVCLSPNGIAPIPAPSA